ncbi:hypothetical protein A2U01_0034853, partial [Trifolium medium]|nr:hypothetical protein [Trifolium medium]
GKKIQAIVPAECVDRLVDVIGLVTNVHYEYADHYPGEGLCAVKCELSDKRSVPVLSVWEFCSSV